MILGAFQRGQPARTNKKEIQAVKSDLLLFLFHLFPVFFLFSLIPRFIVLHLPYIPRHREDERHTHGDGETCRAVEERAIPENAGEEVSSFPHSGQKFGNFTTCYMSVSLRRRYIFRFNRVVRHRMSTVKRSVKIAGVYPLMVRDALPAGLGSAVCVSR